MKKTIFSKSIKFAPLLLGLLGCVTSCTPGGLANPDTDAIDVTIDTRGVTIDMWTGFGSEMSGYLEGILDEFKQLTGITVKHESKGGYPNLLKAINLAATTGKYPHVANGYPDHFASYIKQNILLRLDGFISNDHLRDANTVGDVHYGSDGVKLLDYEDFYPEYTLENETLEFNDQGEGYVLGLPFNKSTEVMVYNKTFFDWCAENTDKLANLGVGPIHLPHTWDEVDSIGKNCIDLMEQLWITSANPNGKILFSDGSIGTNAPTNTYEVLSGVQVHAPTATEPSDFHPFTYDSTSNMFITMVRQYGSAYTELDTTQTGKGYVAFNNAQALSAMNQMQKMFEDGVLGIPSMYNELYCSTAFKAQQSLMNIGSSAGLSNVVASGDSFDIGLDAIPYATADKKYVISQGTSLGLFARGTEKEQVAAWKLMVYLSQQANGLFASQSGYFPTCDFSKNSEEYQDFLNSIFSKKTDELKKQAGVLTNTVYVNDNEHKWNKFVDPGFRGSADIREAIELIPGYIQSKQYGTNQDIINSVYETLSDYVRG